MTGNSEARMFFCVMGSVCVLIFKGSVMLCNQIQSNSASNWFALNEVEFDAVGLSDFQAGSHLQKFEFLHSRSEVFGKSPT